MNNFWAVIIKEWDTYREKDYLHMKKCSGLCFTWDKKHPEDNRKEKSVRVWAIYPRKKDALADAKFRMGSYVKKINIEL